MKKYLKIIYVIVIIIFLKLAFSFITNEIIIRNYKNEKYNISLIKFLYVFNFHESYIPYYNEGNILYQKREYKDAIKKYNKALKKNPPKNRVCDVRINLSLALLQEIDVNSDTVLDELKNARENLYNNGCANENDDNGRSYAAEELEKEIREMEKQTQEQKQQKSNSNSNDNKNKENQKDYKEIEEKLKNIEKNAHTNRQSDLDKYDNMNDFDFYRGKSW